MYAYGHIKDNPEQATDLYTEQCSVSVNAKDLATMAATLANGGKNPVTGKQVMNGVNVPEVLAVMATAGLYDDSGKWLYDTGLPAKSGVGGGIIAVSPGKFGIAVISPPLDAAGNSVRAQKAIADISNALGGNPYGDTGPAHTPGAVQAAGEEPIGGSTFTVNGFAMLDMGYQSKQNDPDWFDVLRPTKLPAFEDQFGEDGHWFSGVRQSRLGVRSSTPTKLGELKTMFEFELFGTGVDAGQTTFRLRHAYGELGAVRRGADLEPVHGHRRVPEHDRVLGTERHGVLPQRAGALDADQGRQPPDHRARAAGRFGRPGRLRGSHRAPERQGPLPVPRPLGRVAVGRPRLGLRRDRRHRALHRVGRSARRPVRSLGRRDRLGPQPQLEHQVRATARSRLAGALRRRHRELHERRAGGRRRPQLNPGDPSRPIEGEAAAGAGDRRRSSIIDWSERCRARRSATRWSTSTTRTGRRPTPSSTGHYALANILFYPVKNVMMGPELQWGERENFSDGFTSDDFRIQFSAKYNFSHMWGGN